MFPFSDDFFFFTIAFIPRKFSCIFIFFLFCMLFLVCGAIGFFLLVMSFFQRHLIHCAKTFLYVSKFILNCLLFLSCLLDFLMTSFWSSTCFLGLFLKLVRLFYHFIFEVYLNKFTTLIICSIVWTTWVKFVP